MFVCQECGAQSPKWRGGPLPRLRRLEFPGRGTDGEAGGAPAGGHRYALAGAAAAAARLYASIDLEQHARLSTGIDEFDRVLGGGIVPGSLVLLGGEPGIGKSTLLLQAAANMARTIGPVLYSSGEESEHQIKSRGERLSVGNAPLYLLAETCLERILEEIARIKPALVDRRFHPDRLLAQVPVRARQHRPGARGGDRSCSSRRRGRTFRRFSSAT